MKRVLWVEDAALAYFSRLTAPLLISGHYALRIATNATDAERYVREARYDAVVVDVRIEPGPDPDWIVRYRAAGNRSAVAKLGLAFLEAVLGASSRSLVGIPWLTPQHVGLLTVEPIEELAASLSKLKIDVYKQKSAQQGAQQLLDVVERILAQQRSQPDA